MKTACLAMIAGLLLTGTAMAQQAPVAQEKIPAASRDARVAELPDTRPLSDYRCLRHTGSLITASRNERERQRPSDSREKPRCAPVAGRAWTREDLERTGAMSVGEALRMLDPSVY